MPRTQTGNAALEQGSAPSDWIFGRVMIPARELVRGEERTAHIFFSNCSEDVLQMFLDPYLLNLSTFIFSTRTYQRLCVRRAFSRTEWTVKLEFAWINGNTLNSMKHIWEIILKIQILK